MRRICSSAGSVLGVEGVACCASGGGSGGGVCGSLGIAGGCGAGWG